MTESLRSTALRQMERKQSALSEGAQWNNRFGWEILGFYFVSPAAKNVDTRNFRRWKKETAVGFCKNGKETKGGVVRTLHNGSKNWA